ncbi:Mitochondrial division protein 1 [Nakaseomyces bracarensis]|uniref:Mitochondrial division protein 1 n=1 Tax=Nakaseomyces bracarensis TaxID=273131 RepID=A0ABR4NM65_9SACH
MTDKNVPANTFVLTDQWLSNIYLFKNKFIDLLYRKIYNSVLFNILMKKNQLTTSFKNQYTSSLLTDRLYFRNLFADIQTSFRVLTYLEDVQLQNLPQRSLDDNSTNETYHSLFQGFIAGLNNKFLLCYQLNDSSDIGIEVKKIFSVKDSNNHASIMKEQVSNANILTRGLELELNTIEEEFERLKQKRTKVRREIEHLTDYRLVLERNVALVEERKYFLQEYDPIKQEYDSIKQDSETLHLKSYNHEHISISNKDLSTPVIDENVIPHDRLLTDNLNEYFEKFEPKNKRSRYIPLALKQKLALPGKLSFIDHAHSDNILNLSFDHPFGLLSSTADLDNEIKLWDLKTNKHVATLSEHLATVNCVQFMKNHSLLISASKDATLKVWNIDLSLEINNSASPFSERGLSSCLTTLEGHNDAITALTIDGTAVVSASNDKTLRHWDLLSGKCIQTIDITMAMKNKATEGISLDNRLLSSVPLIGDVFCHDNALVTGTKDGIIRLWDLRVGRAIGELKGHTDPINTLRFKSNELISGSEDKTSRLWDLRMGSLVELFTYSGSVLCSDFDQTKIINAVHNEGINTFDRSTRSGDILGMTYPVSTFQVDKNYLVLGTTSGSIESWSC